MIYTIAEALGVRSYLQAAVMYCRRDLVECEGHCIAKTFTKGTGGKKS